jgi:putative membrane protein insertion efficiency factor
MLQAALIRMVKLYRFALSPWLGSACRFTPTCSAYAVEALALHGAMRGSYFTIKRICRCHPWAAGGLDPVPASSYVVQTRSLDSRNSSPTELHQQ